MAEDSSSPMTLHFSSEDYAEKDRVGVFCEEVGRPFLSFETETFHGTDFFNNGSVTLLPGLAIASADWSGTICTRTRALAGNSDDVILATFPKGRAFAKQRRSEFVLGNGDGYMQITDELSTTGNVGNEVGNCVQVRLPRVALASSGVDMDVALTNPIPRSNEALQLLIAYAVSVQRLSGPISIEFRMRIASHISDLAVLAIGATGDVGDLAQVRGLRAARLKAVLARISKGFSNPAISALAVAHGLGFSVGYVHELLRETGISFSEHVLELRLQKAFQMLSNRQHDALRISEIALIVGFGDVSYFNRCFRRRFGGMPSGVRGSIFGRECE